METLDNFMMIFRFEPSLDQKPSLAEQEEEQQKWQTWIGGIAAQAKLVDAHRLGFGCRQLHTDHSISHDLYQPGNKAMGGSMIVKAESLDAATELAKGCPILEMGGFVEIRDMIPMN